MGAYTIYSKNQTFYSYHGKKQRKQFLLHRNKEKENLE